MGCTHKYTQMYTNLGYTLKYTNAKVLMLMHRNDTQKYTGWYIHNLIYSRYAMQVYTHKCTFMHKTDTQIYTQTQIAVHRAYPNMRYTHKYAGIHNR